MAKFFGFVGLIASLCEALAVSSCDSITTITQTSITCTARPTVTVTPLYLDFCMSTTMTVSVNPELSIPVTQVPTCFQTLTYYGGSAEPTPTGQSFTGPSAASSSANIGLIQGISIPVLSRDPGNPLSTTSPENLVTLIGASTGASTTLLGYPSDAPTTTFGVSPSDGSSVPTAVSSVLTDSQPTQPREVNPATSTGPLPESSIPPTPSDAVSDFPSVDPSLPTALQSNAPSDLSDGPTAAATGADVSSTAVMTPAPTAAASTQARVLNPPSSTPPVPTSTSASSPDQEYKFGLLYAMYYNPFNIDKDTNYQADFDPTYFRINALPQIGCGQSTTVNFRTSNGSAAMIPGQGNVTTDITAITIIYHGYFVVPYTAYYDFRTVDDDFGFIWIGDAAYNTWTTKNAIYYSIGGSGASRRRTPMYGGEVKAVTLMYANGAGGGSSYFYMNIYDADGNLLDFTSDFSTYFVQPEPSPQWAPQPPFGCPNLV